MCVSACVRVCNHVCMCVRPACVYVCASVILCEMKTKLKLYNPENMLLSERLTGNKGVSTSSVILSY